MYNLENDCFWIFICRLFHQYLVLYLDLEMRYLKLLFFWLFAPVISSMFFKAVTYIIINIPYDIFLHYRAGLSLNYCLCWWSLLVVHRECHHLRSTSCIKFGRYDFNWSFKLLVRSNIPEWLNSSVLCILYIISI